MKIHARALPSTCRRISGATDSGDACSANPCGVMSIQRIHSCASSGVSGIASRPSRQRATRRAASPARLATCASSSPRSAKCASSLASRSSAAARLSSASVKPLRASAVSRGSFPGTSPAARRSLRIAGAKSVAASGRSGTSRAVVRAAISASRASSASWPPVTCWPKNNVAVSGSWCASSRMTVLQLGSSSDTPSSRSMTSAKNRWWLTTTTSASSASLRALSTKHAA